MYVWLLARSSSKYREFTGRHGNWVISTQDSIHRHLVKHLEPTHVARLVNCRALAMAINAVSENQEESVKILQGALRAIVGLSRAFIEGLKDNDEREEINNILETLKSWKEPFELPSHV
jgi:hypothetical protein